MEAYQAKEEHFLVGPQGSLRIKDLLCNICGTLGRDLRGCTQLLDKLRMTKRSFVKRIIPM
jgi:hypothetical protein